ncbi:FAD-binding domain-containing protein [Mycena amicta]|nr:FAD-binding domain-containing protein [Mycena amicta]
MLILALVLAIPLASASQTLLSCLNKNRLNVEGPQNSTWQTSTAAFNMRLHYTPAAIVYPATATDVSKAVKCAITMGVRVSPMSGGHSYSASGYGSQNGALVISFRDMAQISYNPDTAMAAVQPGARLGDVALALNKAGRALAHGVCSYVGVGGHSGFGGFGVASRNWGLLIDQMVSVDIVLANGTLVYASSSKNSQLFWAVRGAAPSFGIVTQYTYKTHKAPASVVRFSYGFSNPDLSSDHFANVISAYQFWGASAPKEMGINANVGDSGRTVELGGYFMGNMDDFKRISSELLSFTGPPNGSYVQVRSWIDALTEVNGGTPLETKSKPDVHDTFYAKSLVTPADWPLTKASLSALAAHFSATQLPTSLSWFIQFELWGGGNSAISSVASTATAYPHRSHLFTIQFYASSSSPGTWPARGTSLLNGMVDAITDANKGTEFGAYGNYIDPELSGWQEMYYAGNYPRLEALKKVFDPRGVFMKAQNIGAPDFVQ